MRLSRPPRYPTLPRVLLDRLLDNAGLDVVPVAVCDVRKGVRVELPALAEPHVHCVVRGGGVLRAGDGPTLQLAEMNVAIVPANTPHGIEPQGEVRRALRVGAAVSSDHVPALTAGSGEPGLVFVCGRIRAMQCEGLGLWERLASAVAVDLSDIGHVHPLLESLLDEQAGRAPGNRRITALAMQQCVVHALRKLGTGDAPCLPWLAALRDPGLSRALDAMLRVPGGPHSAKSLAASASMSRASFGHRFAQAFGQSPMDFLSHMRLQEAMRLLRMTDLSLDAAAAQVGLTASNRLVKHLRSAALGTSFDLGGAGAPSGSGARRRRQKSYAPGDAGPLRAQPEEPAPR